MYYRAPIRYFDSIESREFVKRNGLVDLKFFEAKVWEWVDRAFAMASWIRQFLSHQVYYLLRIASNHYLVLIINDSVVSYMCPFRFEKFWLFFRQS